MHPNLKYRLGVPNRGGHGTQNKPYSRPASSKKRSKSYPIKMWGVIFKDLDPVPTDPTIDPPPKVCFNCWQKGHSQRLCPRPRVGLFCDNCGRRGTGITSCPRCKRRNAEYMAEFRRTGRTLRNAPYQRFDGDEAPEDAEVYDEESELVLRELIRQDEEARRLREQADALLLAAQPLHSVVPKYHDSFDDEIIELKHPISSPSKFDRFSDEYDYNSRRLAQTTSTSNGSSIRRSPSPPLPPPISGSAASRRLAMQSGRLEVERESSPPSSPAVDPVHEVRLLIKSIEHLSKDTQELIIRQVMAERKEKLRAVHGHDDDSWP